MDSIWKDKILPKIFRRINKEIIPQYFNRKYCIISFIHIALNSQRKEDLQKNDLRAQLHRYISSYLFVVQVL